MFARDRPFNDLPHLPPAVDLETKAVLKAVTRASRSLAELKGRTNTIPNPHLLLNTVSLQEARSSSEIENIFTTYDELYRSLSLDDLGLSPEKKEVLHYNEALWKGAKALRVRPFLSTELFIEIVNTISAAFPVRGSSIQPPRRPSIRRPKARTIFGAFCKISKSSPIGRTTNSTR